MCGPRASGSIAAAGTQIGPARADSKYAVARFVAAGEVCATAAKLTDMTLLDRLTIVAALTALNDRLTALGHRAELFLVGGAVMCLVHDARPATRDVDGWFTQPEAVRSAASEVAHDLGLPNDWLNDAAKGFVPANAGYETWANWSNLTIATADARTLLAMKAAAARTVEDSNDIRFLAGHLALRSADSVLAVVLAYFPADRLPVRTRLLLEEMFDEHA